MVLIRRTRSICSNIILRCLVRTTLSCNALQLLLIRGVGKSDTDGMALLADPSTVICLNDFPADIGSSEADGTIISTSILYAMGNKLTHRAKPTPRLRPFSSRRILADKTSNSPKVAVRVCTGGQQVFYGNQV